jgi:hypothetical protein
MMVGVRKGRNKHEQGKRRRISVERLRETGEGERNRSREM